MIYNEHAIVINTKEIAFNTFETLMYSPQISKATLPGQFINILPSKEWENVMRRPMSVASQEGGNISIIYKVVGPGTQIMKNWKVDGVVDIIGPLGNYWDNYKEFYPVLIGGGVGIAPILNLHNMLNNEMVNHSLIMGAQGSRDHFMDHDIAKEIYISTDDGSLGIRGNVIDVLEKINKKKIKIFSCGPPRMMEALKEYSQRYNIECDLALESIMACGFGICQGCSVELVSNNNIKHSYRNKFSLICMDGPIFNARKIKTCHI